MSSLCTNFIELAGDLEVAGLTWHPEIGDEILLRAVDDPQAPRVSVLVDPQGLRPDQLRRQYLWLPTIEQMVLQMEARQAILQHAGLELSERAFQYKTVVHSPVGAIESVGANLRLSMGLALRGILRGELSLVN
jgi:hypothetical protein